MEAVRGLLLPETHSLLEDAENGLWHFPAHAVFEMWEAERVTGDPRNVSSLRAE